jgi:hypothetical protein
MPISMHAARQIKCHFGCTGEIPGSHPIKISITSVISWRTGIHIMYHYEMRYKVNSSSFSRELKMLCLAHTSIQELQKIKNASVQKTAQILKMFKFWWFCLNFGITNSVCYIASRKYKLRKCTIARKTTTLQFAMLLSIKCTHNRPIRIILNPVRIHHTTR